MALMSHRQRVQMALDHQEPDLVPLDFATGGNTSPVPEMYRKLAGLYHIEVDGKLISHVLRLAAVDERILQDLDIDTRPVYMQPGRGARRPSTEPRAFYDDFGVKWKEVQAGDTVYHELAESPLANATLDDVQNYPWWPDPLDPHRFIGVQDRAAYLYHKTDYAIVGCPAFNGVWERTWYLCGFARAFEGLVLEPEFIHAVLRRVTDVTKAALRRFLELTGPYLQVIKLGDDLGGQNGPLMSPKAYRAVVKPYHKELCDLIRQYTGARIFLHTCGSVYRLLPDLIEAGFEVLNPVQVSAAEMDTGRLKAQFGGRLSFWGAIDTQHVLPYGTPEDVEREVERRIADLAPGGGYVLAPVHNVQADVPPENLVTMYRHARRVGRYPLSARRTS
jgi:uroporphyrinogen decarboxylase